MQYGGKKLALSLHLFCTKKALFGENRKKWEKSRMIKKSILVQVYGQLAPKLHLNLHQGKREENIINTIIYIVFLLL